MNIENCNEIDLSFYIDENNQSPTYCSRTNRFLSNISTKKSEIESVIEDVFNNISTMSHNNLREREQIYVNETRDLKQTCDARVAVAEEKRITHICLNSSKIKKNIHDIDKNLTNIKDNSYNIDTNIENITQNFKNIETNIHNISENSAKTKSNLRYVNENTSINSAQSVQIYNINNKLPNLENKIEQNCDNNIYQGEQLTVLQENFSNYPTLDTFNQKLSDTAELIEQLQNAFDNISTSVILDGATVTFVSAGDGGTGGGDTITVNFEDLENKIEQNCDNNIYQGEQLTVLQENFSNYPTLDTFNQKLSDTAELIEQLQNAFDNISTSVILDGATVTFVSAGDGGTGGGDTITVNFEELQLNITNLESNQNYLDLSMAGDIFPSNFNKVAGSDTGSFKFYMSPDPFFTSCSFASDARLKKNIYTLQNCLQKINSMRGVEWNWKKNNKRSTGIIAQEILKIDTDLVDVSNGMMAMNYNALSGYFIEAFKEQTCIQKTQEDKINLLESQLVGQQKEIDTLKTQMKFLLSKL